MHEGGTDSFDRGDRWVLGERNHGGGRPVELRAYPPERGLAGIWTEVATAVGGLFEGSRLFGLRPSQRRDLLLPRRCGRFATLRNIADGATTERRTVVARDLRASLRNIGKRLGPGPLTLAGPLTRGGALVGRSLLNAAATGDSHFSAVRRWTLSCRGATRFGFPAQPGQTCERAVFWRVFLRGHLRINDRIALGLPNVSSARGRLVVPSCHVRLRYK